MRFLLLLLCVFSSLVVHADSFEVSDIRLEGLQRVSAGTVFEAFPIVSGDLVDNQDLSQASRKLFRTALFDDIKLLRDGNVLIVQVVELPTITKIDISRSEERRVGKE